MDRRAQVEGLQAATAAVAVGERLAHGVQDVVVLAERLADDQRQRVVYRPGGSSRRPELRRARCFPRCP